MKKYPRWFIVVIVALVALGVSVVVLPNEYVTRQSAIRTFMLAENFTKVRKIMVRTNAAQSIITMGGGSEFVEQRWTSGSIDPGEKDFGKLLLRNVLSSDPNWGLELDGILRVRTLDSYIGQNVVALEQHVKIVPDFLQSDAHLTSGSDRLLDYVMTTRLEREGENTRVTLNLLQEIKTNAPWFAHGIADYRVRTSAEQTLANQEVAIQKLIEENRDKSWLFPLR